MKVLITGITGMTGSHLSEYLLSKSGIVVHGTLRPQDSLGLVTGFQQDLVMHECDLCDADRVLSLIKEIKPEQIYHLAAETSVADSWSNPGQTITNNISCQLNLLEAVRQTQIETRILITGSSEAYGLVSKEDLPVGENTGFKPLSPYGVSKVSQDILAYQYHKSYGMDIVRVRVFNLTGPRQSPGFALSGFAKQLAMIAAKEKESILMVGNLEAYRDFTDFRDIVKAYWLALQNGQPGEVYNLGSGKSRKLKAVLSMLMDISKIDATIEQNPDWMRPSDIPHMVCDNTRFCLATGWKPEISFRDTLKDLLGYWQRVVENQK